ncbi:Suppressor SRP40-like protein [Melia azedarach]|uniref:Suppressor SRP40-like protein n=1 Tax=Melia azedarach TaxID=155640 RepID=A0ACC1XH47_MELAZ|nr:Suppressor SRP40-like protein [Melia azedarach]
MDSEHRSKNLITCSEFTDGNGSSRHGNLSEVTNMTGSTDHFDIRPEVNGGKRSKNPFEIRPEVVGGNESNKLLETHPAVSDGRHSTSSVEDLFQVDTGLDSFRSFTQPESTDYKIDDSADNSCKSKTLDKWSPGPTSTSQVSCGMPPTQSPPIQVMDRSGRYDPLRIPSSVFESSKSSGRLEWSTNSNESLFSIQIGNNSFSRDQFKSVDLTKSGEFIMFNPSPSIPEAGDDKEGAGFEKMEASVERVKDITRETTVNQSQEKAAAANVLQNPSQKSNHSNDSCHSFSFPVLPDRVQSVAVKSEAHENQPRKPLPTEVTSKSSSFCCWFSCFSCRPRCCSCHCWRSSCCRRCC